MWRFFYYQIVADQEVFNGLGIDKNLLPFQSPAQFVIAESWTPDFLNENGDGLGILSLIHI